LIVPYPPGGGTDTIARLLQPHLAKLTGQQIVVDNRGGASGNIGADIAAKAPANGYTLLMATANLTMAVTVFKKLPFDPIKDFETVSLLAKAPNILAINPGLKATSVKELVELAKATPAKLNYASDGGGPLQLGMELFKKMADVDLTNVPYNGTGPASIAVISGEASAIMAPALAIIPHAKSGRLRALAITSSERLSVLPDLPTVGESGVPGFEANQWYGVLVPAGTPKAIVARLNRDLATAMNLPVIKSRLEHDASIPVASTPAEFEKFLKDDIAKWALAAPTSESKK
jgi:tripartite-type tricarboxylate transporter receptor subunit TctC